MADIASYIEKGREAYEKGLEVLQDMTGWTKVKEANDVIGYTRESEGSAIKTFKTQFYVNKPPAFVSRYIFDHQCEMNMEFQAEDIELMEILERHNDNMATQYSVFKPKGPVNGRDFVTIGIYIELGNDSFCEVGVSIDTDKTVKEGYVRGEIKLMLTLYEPIAGDTTRTNVQVVNLVDPKGNVPSMVINAILANTTTAYEKVRDRLNTLS